MNLTRMTFLSCAVVAALTGACSSSNSSGFINGLDGGAATSETLVTSSAGGKLTAPDGKAVLSVPGGAVSKDVRVTLDVRGASDETASALYRYQPESTVFAVPATVSIGTAGISVPEGKELALAIDHDSEWRRVEGAKPASSAIEARVTALGTFALIFVDAKATGACDSACMAKPGAVCCDGCGCKGAVQCTPTCKTGFKWDCEMLCCFDYETLKCQ